MTVRRMLAWIGSFARSESAATAAEFALVVPVFVIILFVTINGSIMMSAVTQVHYAAERAARCISVDLSSACPDVDAYAKTMYNGPTLGGLAFTLTPGQVCGNRVVGSGTYQLVTGISITSVNISATACYPVI